MGKKKESARWLTEFSEEAIKFTEPTVLLKLIATIDPRGWPHITVITSNCARSKKLVVWGEMLKGTSKENVLKNPKQGLFYMTAGMPFKFIQAKVKFSHTKTEGEDIEYFNKSEFMRYFTYINIYKAYYNDVVAVTPIRNLPLGGIVKGILKDIIGKGGAKTGLEEKRLNVIGYKLFTAPIAVRAIAYIDPSDGYPIIIPCIQLQAADHNRLVFPVGSVLKEDLLQVPVESKVAVLGANFDMASQIVKGTYAGVKKFRGIKFGVIDIEEIYNSCPPLPGLYYPKLTVRPKVEHFNY